MTYFNPKIYCKQNLKESDRKEFEYWKQSFDNAIYNAEFDFTLDTAIGIPAIDAIINDTVKAYGEVLRGKLSQMMQDNLIGIIDGYEEDVQEVEEPETFIYEREEETPDE
jgi:mRNA deadenylase 3'-5' endonuclease subunit Ccr4